MDQHVVAKARRGDADAFEALVVDHHHRLFRVAYGILRDPHLAEDATQQAFLDIWREIRRLRDPARFEAWSYRLLVRVCYREARRRPDWAPESGLSPSEVPLAADQDGSVALRDQLERGFQHLSMDHRTVIVLHPGRVSGGPSLDWRTVEGTETVLISGPRRIENDEGA